MNSLCPEKKVNKIIWRRSKDKSGRTISNENGSFSTKSLNITKTLCASAFQHTGLPENGDASMRCRDDAQKTHLCYPFELSVPPRGGPHMLCLRPVLNVQEWSSNLSIIVFNGTACKGGIGPPVGAVDIGVSKSAYYFRIALPGVRKDPGDFSCEIEHDGKVHIRGVTTTGENTVSRCSRVYTMKFQQQCPPGPFTLSFCLLGPVDPRLCSLNFRSDGIFEAVVAKYE